MRRSKEKELKVIRRYRLIYEKWMKCSKDSIEQK